ncbi:MAG: substrate-binding domain-containing protein [Lachnospiraceae bacterium]|nr:substrate-binding domain-containing protein [Lachnospiraceae bacterium]MDD3615658.1 substrate-binding domain-containing protein [Lachnospiraceae bacterium]
MRKKIVVTLLSAAMVATMVAGCGSKEAADTSADAATEEAAPEESADAEESTDAATAGGDYHFEVVVKSFQSSYWQAALVGMDQAKEELGITYNATGPNAESDIADQVNMLNNAINSAPNGIALAACDQGAVLDSLQTALDKQIPVVCFDTSVPDAPEGSVLSTVVTDNGAAGALAGEKIYEAVKDQIASATAPVRIGEVNQDATSANISERGMGFINKVIELAKADGKTVAVVGNDFFVGQVEDNAAEADADIILEVAVPAQTTVELCSTEASKIMNEADTIAIFGSNQTAAEGVLTANQNLNVLGADGTIVGAGFDAGATIKAAVSDGTFIGAVTQSPLVMGKKALETLTQICNGETVEENIPTDGYWYDATTMTDADIAPNLYD